MNQSIFSKSFSVPAKNNSHGGL